MWTAAHEAHNQGLIKRQDTLAAAWNAFLKTNPPDDKAAFGKGWMAARAAALKAASLDVIFRVGGRPRPNPLKCKLPPARTHSGPPKPGAARAYAARRLALDADRRRGADHIPVREPAVRAALFRRFHAAQHRVLRAGAGDAALRVPHLSGPPARAPGPRRLVRCGAVRAHRCGCADTAVQHPQGGRTGLGIRRRADLPGLDRLCHVGTADGRTAPHRRMGTAAVGAAIHPVSPVRRRGLAPGR